jgi:hypothetical protein
MRHELDLSSIPQRFHSQAVKSRGTNALEKLNYLITWYEKSSTHDGSDGFQREFLRLTGEIAKNLRSILIQDTPELTQQAVLAYVPISYQGYMTSTSSAHREAYAYLTIELNNIAQS